MRELKSCPGAVVFDMDGLMFDSERVVQLSWNAAGEQMGYGPLGDVNICSTLGFNRSRRKEYFLEKYGEGFPFEEFQKAYALVYNDYTKKHGLPVKKGLYELLEVLGEKGIKRAVATSSSRANALENLERAGVLKCFQAVLTGDMVTAGKPSPEIYLKACGLLGTDPERAVALEDAPNGIVSAKAAGMYTIMVPDLAKPPKSILPLVDWRADNLCQVAEKMRGLSV